MKVHTLTAVTDSKYFENCTLIFRTLRTGFPTASVEATVNYIGSNEDRYRAAALAKAAGADSVVMSMKRLHHADWVRDLVDYHTDEGPLIIVDSDVHFWKSCEDWKFDSLLAGFHVPEMWHDLAGCRSMPRLHTSFLWFNDVPKLRAALAEAVPYSGEYVPFNPYMPSIQFVNRERIFWDTCSSLYNIVGGSPFTQEHLDCFEHLNSSSMVDWMATRMGGQTGQDFKTFHSLAPKDMNFVKSFCWPLVKRYYRAKEIEARITPSNFRNPV